MCARQTAPRGRAINHVVMDQSGGLEQLQRHPELDDGVATTAGSLPAEPGQGRAHLLAAAGQGHQRGHQGSGVLGDCAHLLMTLLQEQSASGVDLADEFFAVHGG